MPERARDETRERRIEMEIVVEASSAEEQALGWYDYVENTLQVPFLARCVAERAVSPRRVGDEVEVVGVAPEEECGHGMFVLTPWERRTLAVPLAQLAGITADAPSERAIEDWRDWVERGDAL
jgi:hypothetical protein